MCMTLIPGTARVSTLAQPDPPFASVTNPKSKGPLSPRSTLWVKGQAGKF